MIIRAIGGVGDDLILRAAPKGTAAKTSAPSWPTWAVPIAACLMVGIIVTVIMHHLHDDVDRPIAYTPPSSTTTSAVDSDPSIDTAPAADADPVYNPNIGGGGYEISYRFFPMAENLFVASQIVGQEAYDDWYVNVYLNQSPEERVRLPALYQIINAFDISMEDLIRENESYTGSDYYLDEYVVDALYRDEALMMYLLRHPLTLYFDGEIYTYYEVRGFATGGIQLTPSHESMWNLPSEVYEEYFDRIESIGETNEDFRDIIENIDAFWETHRQYLEAIEAAQ